ncbi:hypothetical protein [Mycoplasma wenyonii]|uniref:hypothetical protein n=1 Tax=Mycoplasma wenyonii TaxID=65123 RepID=UPI000DD947FE|nr:hypothetical protein [Mycoplasma wenyonii]
MNIKLFVAVAALGGGCVGVPLYLFLQTGKPSGAVSRPSLSSNVSVTKVTQSDTNMEQKSIARGECTVIDLPQEIQSFLGDKYTGQGDYVATSCTNTNVRNDYTPLPANWIGWFPRFMFSASSSTTKDSKLEITTETKVEDGDSGSYTEISFIGSGLMRTFKAKLETIPSQNLDKEVSTASVWGQGYGNKLVYLFMPKTVVSEDQN